MLSLLKLHVILLIVIKFNNCPTDMAGIPLGWFVSTDPKNINFWIFHTGNSRSQPILMLFDPDRAEEQLFREEASKYYSRDAKLFFYHHGFLQSGSDVLDSCRKIIQDESKRNVSAVCTIVDAGTLLDFSWLNLLNYWQASKNIEVIGRKSGLFQSTLFRMGLLNPDTTFNIGFSLGCHSVGQAGEIFRNKTKITMSNCMALDPAGPLFYGWFSILKIRREISKVDCKNVVAYHTDPSIFGTNEPTGHVDVYFGSTNCPTFLDLLSYPGDGSKTLTAYATCPHSFARQVFDSTTDSYKPLLWASYLCVGHVESYINCPFKGFIPLGLKVFSLERHQGLYFVENIPKEWMNS